MKIETKVGLFIVVGLIFLFGLSTQVNNFKAFEEKGYTIYALIDNVNGLEINAKVKASGLKIGRVEEFELIKNRVRVRLSISKSVKVPKNSLVSLKQESMLGVKFLDISFSDEDSYLIVNESLDKSKKFASFDQTSDTINLVAKRLDQLIQDNKKNIKELIINFKDVGAEFKLTGETINRELPNLVNKFNIATTQFAEMSKEFQKSGIILNKDLKKILDNINNSIVSFGDMSKEFEQTGKEINKKLPDILSKFEEIEDSVQVVIDENKQNLNSAIQNIDSAFAGIDSASVKVEDAFEKLDDYLSSTTNSILEVHFKDEYLVNDSSNKIYIGADYSPKPTIHYLFDFISMDDLRDDGTGKPIETKIHQESRDVVSAQYGKDFNNLRLRLGLIEGTGGVGFDYFMFNKKLKTSFDAYDFNAYNDIRGDDTHLKVLVRYNTMKHLNFYLGYDNFLNEEATNFVFGAGVNFVDEDLKYLIGGSGLTK